MFLLTRHVGMLWINKLESQDPAVYCIPVITHDEEIVCALQREKMQLHLALKRTHLLALLISIFRV